MKRLLGLFILFSLFGENISHAQTKTSILSNIDTKIVNNPRTPLRAYDLNVLLKSVLNYGADTLIRVNDSTLRMKKGSDSFNVVVAGKPLTAPFRIGSSYASQFISSDSAYNFSRDFDPTRAGNGHGITVSDCFKRNADGYAYAAFDARGILTGTADYNHMVAFQNVMRYRTTGTTSYGYGMFSQPLIDSGALDNYSHIKINDISGGGTVNDNYGILINWLGKGTGVNYGILSNADVKFTKRLYFNYSYLRDTSQRSELKQSTWLQPSGNNSAYIVANANTSSEAGIGYYRSFGGSSGYRLAVGIKSTNSSTTTPLLTLMKAAGQTVIGDSVVNDNPKAKLVVNGSTIFKDSIYTNGTIYDMSGNPVYPTLENVVQTGSTSTLPLTIMDATIYADNTDANTVVGNTKYESIGENNSLFGYSAGYEASGDNNTFIGTLSGLNNTGDYVTAIGSGTASANSYSFVNLIGTNAAATANDQTVFGGRVKPIIFNHDVEIGSDSLPYLHIKVGATDYWFKLLTALP